MFLPIFLDPVIPGTLSDAAHSHLQLGATPAPNSLSTCTRATHLGDKVQKVHAGFVGFSVRQFEQRRQFKSYSIASIPSLKKANQETKINTSVYTMRKVANKTSFFFFFFTFGTLLTAFMILPACSTKCNIECSSSQDISSVGKNTTQCQRGTCSRQTGSKTAVV